MDPAAALDAQPPLLSIVLCGRNDDHGVKFLDRTLAALTFNRRNLVAAGIPHEVIFVDWAFDPGRELFVRMLRRELPWLHQLIAVDREFQERKKTNPRLAFMEFWAKNVGVRRARAPFVLTTNSDVFFSRGLVSWLKHGRLERDRCYRAIRIDIKLEVTSKDIAHEILESPQAVSFVNLCMPPHYTNASGDFLMMSRELWDRVRGFNEILTWSKVHLDSNFCINIHDKYGVPLEVIGKIWHLEHKTSLNLSQNLYGPRNELAPYGPDWDYWETYENPPNWGLVDRPERVAEDGIRFIDWAP